MNKGKRRAKQILAWIFRFLVCAGIIYIIIGPLITVITHSFFSNDDLYNSLVYLIPKAPTLERYEHVIRVMGYVKLMGKTLLYDLSLTAIQLFVCSMTGYGFARFEFPFKKLLFGVVVLTIIIPSHTIMLPLYQTFKNFDPLGIVTLTSGEPQNILNSYLPMYVMTFFGCGLRSGLYIYIFNQFFRGIPKEIEEAAYIDGAGSFYTYFRVMLVNALPSILTVTVFSLVWQYNDSFFPRLFVYGSDNSISIKLMTLSSTISYVDKVSDPNEVQLYVYAAIVLAVLPVLLVYLLLQRYFMEGVERSGIVG